MPESGNVCPGQSLLQSSELETQALSLDTLCSTDHVSSVTKSLQNKGNQANQTTHSPEPTSLDAFCRRAHSGLNCALSQTCVNQFLEPAPMTLLEKNDPVDPFSPVASWEFVGESLRERGFLLGI